MADHSIEYSEKFGIDTFKHEIVKELGEKVWQELTFDGIIPNIDTESKCKCINMVTFMERFDKITDKSAAKKALSKVRHGIKPSQSSWAREKFLKIGNLDVFIKQILDESIANFEKLHAENKDFYGDKITKEALDFLNSNPSILIGVRK
ncbi:MAG: hypothetical protein LBU85_07385 [Treponema sp.]|jgi:hypothetical protein|nr:hypothetical protein [Treponema sp.]